MECLVWRRENRDGKSSNTKGVAIRRMVISWVFCGHGAHDQKQWASFATRQSEVGYLRQPWNRLPREVIFGMVFWFFRQTFICGGLDREVPALNRG